MDRFLSKFDNGFFRTIHIVGKHPFDDFRRFEYGDINCFSATNTEYNSHTIIHIKLFCLRVKSHTNRKRNCHCFWYMTDVQFSYRILKFYVYYAEWKSHTDVHISPSKGVTIYSMRVFDIPEVNHKGSIHVDYQIEIAIYYIIRQNNFSRCPIGKFNIFSRCGKCW